MTNLFYAMEIMIISKGYFKIFALIHSLLLYQKEFIFIKLYNFVQVVCTTDIYPPRYLYFISVCI